LKRTWLALDGQDLAYLREVNEPAWLYAEVEQADLSADEIIVVGRAAEAKGKALSLTARGIDATRLSYVDLLPGDDFFVRIGKPKHMFWDDVVPVSELNAEEDFAVYPTGLGFLQKNLGWYWRLPELVIMCGPYGCGKSTLGQVLATCFVNEKETGRALGSGAMLCSWEDLESEVFRNVRNFAQANDVPDMVGKIHFVRRRASEERLVSWYMDLVRYHRRRFGTRFFFLDPWNEMDHQRDPRQMETDYVKDAMRAFRDLVDQEQIILVIATHIPGKFIRGDGSIEPFKIGHAFGSSNFGNKADRGICLVRTKKFDPRNGHAIIRLDKAKVERKMGHRGTVAARLDVDRFALEYDGHATLGAQDIWKD
jgi:archaellum biogenesis ATPase FlaH